VGWRKRIYFGDHGESRAQLAESFAFIVQPDSHGYALHNLCEVASSILGRQHTELRTGRRGDTEDTPAKHPAANRIHFHGCWRSRTYPGELTFLEVRVNPESAPWDKRDHLRTRSGIGTHLGASISHDAIDGRAQFCITYIEPCEVPFSYGLLQGCQDLLLLRVDDLQLPLRRHQAGARFFSDREGLFAIRLGLLRFLN